MDWWLPHVQVASKRLLEEFDCDFFYVVELCNEKVIDLV